MANLKTRKNPHGNAKNARTRARQSAFLAAFAQCGYVGQACAAAGIDRDRPADWSRTCPEFAERYEEARDEFVEGLEMEADRRAMKGTKRYLFRKGVPVVDPATGKQRFERVYSDGLLMERLKALCPEKYRENYHGPRGGEAKPRIVFVAPPPRPG